MKIGAGADTRALNLSLPSGAAESTDISALFDELLALNVSAQSGNAPSNANAQPNDTSAAPGQTRSSQTTPQNFMQALLSTTQQPAPASAAVARPIPAQPGNSGFPRVAALVANPAWPPRTGTAPQAAPAAANGTQSKIIDIKQQVNAKSATPSSGMASAKTIADLLQSALSEAPATARAGGLTPANPAAQKPDVVMDARSFAKIASFVMPVAAKPAPAATAAPSATAQAPLIANNPVALAETAAIPQAASEPASEFDADASPEQTEPDQNAAFFADSNNVKFINSNGRLAAPAIATTRAQAPFAPPITVFDAIEGLRAAILPDQESAASPTLKMLAAAAQQSQTTPSATATPGAKPQPASQAVSQPASDPKAALQISNFIAAAGTNPVTVVAQPTIIAASDPKSAATPQQSAPQKTLPPQTIATDVPQASDVKLVIPAQNVMTPSVIAKAIPVYTEQSAVLPPSTMPPVAGQKPVTAFVQPATSQGPFTQPAVASALPSSGAKSEMVRNTSASVVTEQTVPQDVQTSSPAPTQSQPIAQQVSSAKSPALPQPNAADTKTLSALAQSAPQVSTAQPTAPQTSDIKAPALAQNSQPVVEAKVIPQTAQPPISAQPETQSQPVVQPRDAEIVPQKNSDPAPAEAQTIAVQSPDTKQAGQEQPVARRDAKLTVQQPAPQHETKQIVSRQQDALRDASTDSKPDAQAIQQPVTAPQLVADVKDIVQSILATQVSTASVKTVPQSVENTSARGSLASAFAAAAVKSKSQPSQSQPRAAQTQINGKLSADGKDNSPPAKNASSAQSGDASDTSTSKNQTVAPKNQTPAVDETPAIAAKIDVNASSAAPTKSNAPAPTDITPDNATQNPVAPQLANSAPQTPITLPNDLGVTVNAVQQPNAPHTVNLAAFVQVAPQSQNTAHTMQADLSALALSIAAKSLDGVKHFDIRLDPAELGRVQVRLSIDESGKAAAHLSAERPQTLELLQRDAPALTRALKDSGVDLSQNGLNFSLKGQNQQNGNGNGAPSRGTPLEAKLVTNPEASAIPLHIKTDNVRLDIHV